MKKTFFVFILFFLFDLMNFGGVEVNFATEGSIGTKKKPEDAIPVIEIRGEGKPMTAAQIRQLEEISNGGPLDIKV